MIISIRKFGSGGGEFVSLRKRSACKTKAMMKPPRLFLLSLLLFTATEIHAKNTAEAIIYLNDGTTIEITDRDRIRLPRGREDLQILRDAFRRKSRETIAFRRIDSLVCWHAQNPQHRRKFIPATGPGWLWVYFETPAIRVGIRAGKGYAIASNGGIHFKRRKGIFRRAGVDYYADKQGEEFVRLGTADRRATGRFRKRLAGYVADDPATAELILRSSTHRSKTVQLLHHYTPAETKPIETTL